MSTSREELEWALRKYFEDTFSFIKTIKTFITTSSEWIRQREEEKSTLANISEKASDIRNRFEQVKKAKQKMKAFGTFVGDSIVPGRALKKQSEEEEELQEELELLVQRIQEGLLGMQIFLEAVEKLTVTSDHVFEQNQVVQLSEETDLESVRRIIFAARLIGPLLLLFKRNNEDFFKAKVHNVEVMEIQLNQYICTIKHICSAFTESSVADLSLKESKLFVDLHLSEEDSGKMLERINTLEQIRENKHFRMVFLFREEHRIFIEMFGERKERMLEVLDELEPCAVQLDRMNFGARVSNVVGSSVGVMGGFMAIVGLALAPVTAGVSLGLTIAGAATAATSGANSVVTMFTEMAVNSTQKKKANEAFKVFMKDVDDLQNCVKKAIDQNFQSTDFNDVLKAVKLTGRAGMKSIDAIFDSTAALKGPLALSKAARGGFIALNALFIGVDMFIIANEGANLSWGSETETSKWIRARAALWRSEVESLQTICDSLEKGQKLLEKKHLLQESFYE